MGGLEDDLQHSTLKQAIPKIHKRLFLEGVLFGWIRGQKKLVPALTIEKSIYSFYDDSDITEKDWPLQDCKTTYKRMTKEFFDEKKTKAT